MGTGVSSTGTVEFERKLSWSNRVLIALLFGLMAPGVLALPIDFNDFYADPSVTINVDGTEAIFAEDVFVPVVLSNDPSLGDPPALDPDVLGSETLLSFEYSFSGSGAADSGLLVSLFEADASTGLGGIVDGFLDDFELDFASGGLFELDLAGYTLSSGSIFGLQFEFFDLDSVIGNSVLTIANLATFDPNGGPVEPPAAIPAPPAVWLMLTGLAGLYLRRRRRSS